MSVVSTHGFPKKTRLLRKADFDYVFKCSRYQNKQHFFLLLATFNTCSYARLGLIAPKKHNVKAVSRNQAKRLCRACFCEVRLQLPSMDIVILIKTMSNQDMKRLLRPALTKSFQQLVAYAAHA